MAAPGRVTNRDVVALNVTISRLTDPTRVAETSAAATRLHAWQLACPAGRYDHKATVVAHPQAPSVLLSVYAARTHPILAPAFAGRPTHDVGAAALTRGHYGPTGGRRRGARQRLALRRRRRRPRRPPGTALLPQLCATALTANRACARFTVYVTDEYMVRIYLPTRPVAAWARPSSSSATVRAAQALLGGEQPRRPPATAPSAVRAPPPTFS